MNVPDPLFVPCRIFRTLEVVQTTSEERSISRSCIHAKTGAKIRLEEVYESHLIYQRRGETFSVLKCHVDYSDLPKWMSWPQLEKLANMAKQQTLKMYVKKLKMEIAELEVMIANSP